MDPLLLKTTSLALGLGAFACKAMIPEFRYGRSKEEDVAVAPRHAPFG